MQKIMETLDFEERDKFIAFFKNEAIDIPDYEIVDVKEPKLYKNIFPFNEAPKAVFDGVVVNTNIPDKLLISDTTFRDGQQSREPYSVEQIANLFKMLHDLGGNNGKVNYTEFFPYTKKDREAIEKCKYFGYEFPRITGWIRASKADLQHIKDLKLEETGILASVSDYHIFYKFEGKTRSQVIQNYLDVTEEALKSGITVRLHLEDITRADIFGTVVPFVKKAMKLAEKYDLPVKFRCPDTLGVGLPWPEAALPRGIPKLFWLLNKALGVPSEWLEFHGQNDFHLGVSNATSAWLYGASFNNCTLLGIGERAGNIPMEAMIFVHSMIKGSFDGMNTKVLRYVTEYYEKKLNYKLPYYYPIIGKNFNVTRAGIHADGLLKNLEMYLPFNTEELLDIPPKVMVSEHSGIAGIAFWVNSFFRLKDGEKITKDEPTLEFIQNEVIKQYQEGRVTTMLDEEVITLVKKYLPDICEKYKNRVVDS